MKTPVFKDKAGVEIKAGDLLVYGVALGRCASLQYGKVVRVQWSNSDEYAGNGEYKQIPKLRVRGVSDTHWKAKGDEFMLLKESTLAFSSRVLILNRAQVPAKALKLLDEVEV